MARGRQAATLTFVSQRGDFERRKKKGCKEMLLFALYYIFKYNSMLKLFEIFENRKKRSIDQETKRDRVLIFSSNLSR